jgi:hypothetical protein
MVMTYNLIVGQVKQLQQPEERRKWWAEIYNPKIMKRNFCYN